MYDVIIIGTGPAGYTAALYASRAFLKTLLIAGPEPGGQLTTTTQIDNFPGYPEGIFGPQLMDNMKKQAGRFGAEIKIETVKEVKSQKSKANNTFSVTTESNEYEARSVIIATGASAKRLGIPSEEAFRGKGISYCATCDGFFFRGKNIAVFGGGDTAMEEATFLTKFAAHVTVIHRRDEFRASPIMIERAKNDPKISFLLNTTVKEFYGDAVLKGVRLQASNHQKNQTEKKDQMGNENAVLDLPIDGAFIAIGHQPNTAFLRDFVELDEKGYVKLCAPLSAMDEHTVTTVRGVFAAGDCVDPRYRQAIIAAGMGCQAALDAQKWLEEG